MMKQFWIMVKQFLLYLLLDQGLLLMAVALWSLPTDVHADKRDGFSIVGVWMLKSETAPDGKVTPSIYTQYTRCKIYDADSTYYTVQLHAVAVLPASAQYSTYIWKADSLYLCGEYAQSSAMFEKAFQSERDVQGQHLYNAACVAALSGDADKAFQRLFARLEKEPAWYSETFEQDEDLMSLHGDARWKVCAISASP